jgi:VRR-NUC domain
MRWTEQEYHQYALARRWSEAHDAARPRPDPTPERTLLAQIRKVATDNAYRAYHTHDSRKSALGFPDLCLIRVATTTSAGRLIFAELKSEHGKATQEQLVWLDMLRHTIPGVEVYVWRPSDLRTIVEILLKK